MSAQTQTLILLIANYFKTQPVLKAWLFGSYAQVCNSTLKICWDVKLTLLKTERFARGLLKV